MPMPSFKLLLLASAATGVLMQPASALEAQAFVDRVAEVYQHIGYDFEFGPATLDGDTVTVDGVTVNMAGLEGTEDEPTSFTTDTVITFSGVTERPDGSYMAQSVTIPDIDADFAEEPTGHITLSDIRLDGLYVPAGDTVPATDILQLVASISTGPLTIEREGAQVFAYERMEAANTFNPEQGSDALVDMTASLSITGMALDLSSIEEDDPGAAETIEQLGLTNVTGDITQRLTWSMADGRMVVDEFLFDFADVGALDINLDITGMTPAVLDQIYAMQAQMAATGEEASEEQSQAQMMQGMAIMQGVSIAGASIRYDDASLAGKLLDYFAAQSGSDRAGFVEGLKATLPGLVAQSGIPALNDLVVPPVSAFLDDPQSIEIAVAPPSPTSVLVLMAAAANPAGLITALGLSVQANQQAD
ncbi:hypothetical protein [Devosia submarina]|uniref:hypothetical protein n=1 Tax=Devosia submarina TaxID=1173082 RepID=UPI000D3527D3|nr:hypothetical protein [Devosia submarina]